MTEQEVVIDGKIYLFKLVEEMVGRRETPVRHINISDLKEERYFGFYHMGFEVEGNMYQEADNLIKKYENIPNSDAYRYLLNKLMEEDAW